MFTEEVIAMLKEVIFSWQVLAVTVVIVLYLNIVFYTAKSYHRPKAKPPEKVKAAKKKAEPGPALPDAGKAEDEDEAAEPKEDSNADLGLEESE